MFRLNRSWCESELEQILIRITIIYGLQNKGTKPQRHQTTQVKISTRLKTKPEEICVHMRADKYQ